MLTNLNRTASVLPGRLTNQTRQRQSITSRPSDTLPHIWVPRLFPPATRPPRCLSAMPWDLYFIGRCAAAVSCESPLPLRFFQLCSLAHVALLCLNSFSSDPHDSGTLFHGEKKQRRRRWSGEYGLLPRGFPQWNRALRQIKSGAASVGSTEGKKKSLFFFSSSCFICMLFPFSSRPFRLTSLTSRGCLTVSPLRDD